MIVDPPSEGVMLVNFFEGESGRARGKERPRHSCGSSQLATAEIHPTTAPISDKNFELRKRDHHFAQNSARMTTMTTSEDKIYLQIHYGDTYVQPLLLAALRARLPPELLIFLKEDEQPPSPDAKLLQWRQYETIDFEHLLAHPGTSLANSYVIRKALIRKHYLSTTISHWLTKNPGSVLKDHVKGGVEFEVDYVEFLDDALVEAWEMKESWGRNGGVGDGGGREWWILKPGMSERGQGIRLFSSEEELIAIFEEWDPPSDDEDEEDEDGEATHSGDEDVTEGNGGGGSGIMTSQLRHFVAQPYIHPPLLLPPPHESAGRKFHIRTYVLAVGALKVYIYKPMLALFAGHPYSAPTTSNTTPSHLNAHLTNTCLQNGSREGSVHTFWSLPSTLPNLASKSEDWRRDVFDQICAITGETFEAAARTMGIHFQPLPNAFEIFGLDFLVDGEGKAWLLEVNAFPDFAQTGGELQGVVKGLMEGVVEVGVRPFFGLESRGAEEMVGVLDIDLGRR
ncbi:hypothetical protein LTR17_004473 [Elasticomyces elasticus]|nr:hypothetical protein LTR17_004473 [Elasticomyces elasticus]